MNYVELQQAFLKQLHGEGKSPATVNAYGTAVSKFHAYLIERNIDLDRAPAYALKDFAVWLTEQGMAPRSVNTWIVGSVKYLEWLREYEKVQFTAPGFHRPDFRKVPKEVQETPTSGQVALYISEVAKQPEPYRTAMYLIPFSGLRRDELCHLTLDRVEHDAPRKRYIFRPFGKGQKERLVPLLRLAHDTFQTYLVGWRRQHPSRHPWVFPGERDCAVSAKVLADRVLAISRRLKVPHLNPHAMRRFYAHYLEEQMGLDVEAISSILGHSSVDTTRLYLQQDRSRVAIAKLERKEEYHADQR